tara:strand:- start:21330 stop:21761 length:432 start_codon:yes stop_codon:yes gene_type:complete
MADKNRYWFVKRNKLALVEDSTSSSKVNGVARRYQNLQTQGLSIRYDAVLKNPHFNRDEIPSVNSDWGFTGNDHTSQKPIFQEQFHDAIVYKAISLGYEITAGVDVEKAQYFQQRYQQIVKKAKGFSRRYYNGGTMRINPIDF